MTVVLTTDGDQPVDSQTGWSQGKKEKSWLFAKSALSRKERGYTCSVSRIAEVNVSHMVFPVHVLSSYSLLLCLVCCVLKYSIAQSLSMYLVMPLILPTAP